MKAITSSFWMSFLGILFLSFGFSSTSSPVVQAASPFDSETPLHMSLIPSQQIVSCYDPAAKTQCADGTCTISTELNACQGHGGITGLVSGVALPPDPSGVSKFRVIYPDTPPTPIYQPVAAMLDVSPTPAVITVRDRYLAPQSADVPISLIPNSGGEIEETKPSVRLIFLSGITLLVLIIGAARMFWRKPNR
jgi:hypothetical protein